VRRLLLVLLVVVLLLGVPVARAAGRFCRRLPRYRNWFIAGASVLLLAAAAAVPRLDRAIPDRMRESPAGLIPFLGAAAGLGVIALVSIAALVGALLSRRPPSRRPGD